MRFLGIDLGGTNVKIGVCDGGGTAIRRTKIATEPHRGPHDVIARIAQAARPLIRESDPVAAWGVCAPGGLDLARQPLTRPNHFPAWTNVPLAQRLGELLGMSATLEND